MQQGGKEPYFPFHIFYIFTESNEVSFYSPKPENKNYMSADLCFVLIQSYVAKGPAECITRTWLRLLTMRVVRWANFLTHRGLPIVFRSFAFRDSVSINLCFVSAQSSA